MDKIFPNMGNEHIITKNEYFELRCAREKLSRLESGGVDNWDWYFESLYPNGYAEWEEFERKLEEEIYNI